MSKSGSKKKFAVLFLPEGKKVLVDGGKTILEASEIAGILLNATCGGKGVCGRCKVIVKSGEVNAKPTFHLTSEEIESGYVLACRSYVCSDIVVEVPAETRFDDMLCARVEDFVGLDSILTLVGQDKPYIHDPLIKKVFLEISPPTLEDNLGDMERLFREVRRVIDFPVINLSLGQLKQLPKLMRESNWKVTATLGKSGGAAEIIQIEGGNSSAHNYGVAVDVGTTTVVSHLVDLNSCKTVACEAKYNSQIQYGEDVISRIMFANTEEKLSQLSSCIVADINELIERLVVASGVARNEINLVICAGNTTMTHFLLGLDPSNIRVDPYVPVAVTPPVIKAAEVGISINPNGLLACVPSVASYVGGDVVAGVLVSGMARSDVPCMFIDLGTNGEIVIGNKDWLACCSASAGPAFEGGGISCGMRATSGAIEQISMKDCKTLSYSVIGRWKAYWNLWLWID